ncbi:MAG: hypothetical protein GQ570_06745 [Helicobacteraceae bacterium]|nr:hypothetical protein [Helicobacteraceae bacterium]
MQSNGKIFIILVVAVFSLTGLFFLTNPSYEKSMEAKYYYAIGDYKEALKLANEAYTLDNYNKMATTIIVQSEISVKFLDYIDEAKKYISKISQMANVQNLSRSDRARMKIMTSIMIQSYKKISPTILTDKELVQDANYYYEQFVSFNEKLDSTK